jgi:hypothetical protein
LSGLWSAYIDEKVADAEIGEAMTARLKERYQHEVVPQLRQTYAYENPHEYAADENRRQHGSGRGYPEL